MSDPGDLHPSQLGLGDMDVDEFRRAGHRVVEQIASYLESVDDYPVAPQIEPGIVRSQIPDAVPPSPEPIDTILDDYARLIEPNITHWQHPAFLAYFSSVACGPGILGEMLAAGLNSNVMFWRNAPASTELEEVVVGWLTRLMGLPDEFDGMLTDTASISSLLSVVAARHAVPGLGAKDKGIAGRADCPTLRLYCSTEAHSSIEKAAIVAGVGRDNVVRVAADRDLRMDVDKLEAAIRSDAEQGMRPFCVVATCGTTSSTSVDPLARIASVCRDRKLWYHVDAAYAGAAAVVREMRGMFAGWERADSIVVNPHKWLFTPFDASLLLFREPDLFRDAFSLVPEYLRAAETADVHNYHEYGIQLGRRFRALKLWMILRYFGADGMASRVSEHCRLARMFRDWVAAESDWQILAPTPFSTVCFRFCPQAWQHSATADQERQLDEWNRLIMEKVNLTGRAYLSHTKLHGRYTIRVSIGNPRTREEHLERCWELLKACRPEL